MLDRQGLTKRDIGGFSVVSGPGSFTGLRVGLAAVKALAEILEKPIAATSLLEALAHACAEKGNVTAVLDAGRGELFAGESEIEDGRVKLVDEGLLSVEELVAKKKPRVVTSDQALADKLRASGVEVRVVPQQSADAIARIGVEKIRAGQTVSAVELDATYIRRSDAELKHLTQ
jgi:tRNA threonylcarbamoyladenosine biosynthesis protein TsaB